MIFRPFHLVVVLYLYITKNTDSYCVMPSESIPEGFTTMNKYLIIMFAIYMRDSIILGTSDDIFLDI